MKLHWLILSGLLIILTGCTQTREQIEPVDYDIPKMFSSSAETKDEHAQPFEALKEQPDFSQVSVVAVGGRKQSTPQTESVETEEIETP